MYCEFKNNQWWVWSSRKASLDCLPQYKVTADTVNDVLLSVFAIKQTVSQAKIKTNRLERRRAIYKENREARKKAAEFNKAKESRLNEKLYKWASNLN